MADYGQNEDGSPVTEGEPMQKWVVVRQDSWSENTKRYEIKSLQAGPQCNAKRLKLNSNNVWASVGTAENLAAGMFRIGGYQVGNWCYVIDGIRHNNLQELKAPFTTTDDALIAALWQAGFPVRVWQSSNTWGGKITIGENPQNFSFAGKVHYTYGLETVVSANNYAFVCERVPSWSVVTLKYAPMAKSRPPQIDSVEYEAPAEVFESNTRAAVRLKCASFWILLPSRLLNMAPQNMVRSTSWRDIGEDVFWIVVERVDSRKSEKFVGFDTAVISNPPPENQLRQALSNAVPTAFQCTINIEEICNEIDQVLGGTRYTEKLEKALELNPSGSVGNRRRAASTAIAGLTTRVDMRELRNDDCIYYTAREPADPAQGLSQAYTQFNATDQQILHKAIGQVNF